MASYGLYGERRREPRQYALVSRKGWSFKLASDTYRSPLAMSPKFLCPLALGLLLPLQFAYAERFKVGSIAATSGQVAELAQAIVDARELAANHINANGGVLDGRLVELVSADSGCDPQVARGAAAQLVQDPEIVALVGPTCTAAAVAIGKDVAVPAGLALVSDAATGHALSELDDNDLVFRTAVSDAAEGAALAQLAAALKLSRVAVIHLNDDYQSDMAKAFSGAFTTGGGEVTRTVDYVPPVDDFSSLIKAASESKPDALALFTYFSAGGTELLLANERDDAFAKILTPQTMQDEAVVQAIKGNALAGKLFSTRPASVVADPSFKAFALSYSASGGDANAPFVASGYDAVFLVALAAQQAQSTRRADIARALRQVSGPPGVSIRPGEWAKAKALLGEGIAVDYRGASGEVDFGSTGDVTALFYPYTVGPEGGWERVDFE